MALLNVVTAITQEITYLNEMISGLARSSESRIDALRKRHEAAVEEERTTTAAVIAEIEALKKKLGSLIEEK